MQVHALLEKDYAVRQLLGKADNWSLRRDLYVSLAVAAVAKGVPDVALRLVDSSAALGAMPSFAGGF